MRIYITSDVPSASLLQAREFSFSGMSGGFFELEESLLIGAFSSKDRIDAVVCFTPLSAGGHAPLCAQLELIKRGGGFDLKAASNEGTLRVIDWSNKAGEALFELDAHFSLFSCETEPARLDGIEFECADGEKAALELYRDGGLRLTLKTPERESGYMLGGGEGGSLRALDIGSARVIIVHAEGCRRREGFFMSAEAFERLIVLNERLELIGTVEGGRCYIENGVLNAVDPLGTVLCHEHRRRYALSGEGLKSISEGADGEDAQFGEVGYFTHPMRVLQSPVEKATALVECILLGREDEAMALISPALKTGLDFGVLCGFFGDMDEVRHAPWAIEKELPILGALKADAAIPYEFCFENGLISDIAELEPPYLRRGESR